ncbi:MAG: 50S ribosomal protein L29 [Candidatus Marinimicrobia bacterium]|nr:50S ribosomal protein L29 [Candidatus Neomarinimicrobiota bacterium]
MRVKTQELRELTHEEADIRLRDALEEMENLRFQHSLRQLENHQRIKSVRREIAQLNTILRENKLGISTFAGSGGEDEK